MIDAKELRQGNDIMDGQTIVQVLEILADSINTDQCEGAPYEELSPIDLSPSILEAAGFKKYKADRPYKLLRLGRMGLIERKEWWSIEWFDANDDYGTPMAIIVTSLHQLQNLYFALIGQELTINLTTQTSKP